jgi:carbon-monoxide dehydrogenase medium subunit
MRFDYLEPQTFEEAVSLLGKHNGKAKVIAGGTDLINQIRLRTTRPEYVIDIGFIPDLDYTSYDKDGRLAIGAMTTIRTLETSSDIQKNHPVISQAAGELGSMAIRNVGTIGGNLSNAAPSAETAPALIGLGASVKIFGPDGEREVFLDDFFIGPGKTILRRGEIMREIRVPPMAVDARGVYLKHSIKGTADLAVIGVAAIGKMDSNQLGDIRIVLGAVAPTPIRAMKAEEILKGKYVDGQLIEKAARTAAEESSPITDVRATADYRKEMIAVFTRYALNTILDHKITTSLN